MKLRTLLVFLALMAITLTGNVVAYNADYTAEDLPDVAGDVLGEGLVQTKTYMPLLILVMVVNIAITAWVGWRVSVR